MTENRQIPSFRPARTRTATEVVYDQIYQMIVEGKLKPGDRLPAERVLADQFKRSRHTIREALRMLQQDGLVRIEVGSSGGTFVQSVSLSTVEGSLRKFLECGAIAADELVEYRHINDHGCARLASLHCTEEDAEKIQGILDAALEAVDDPLSFQEYDIEFHRALAEASHNNLAILINDIIVALNTNMFLGRIRTLSDEEKLEVNDAIYKSHNAIFQAVLKHDPVEADHCVDDMVDLFYRYITMNESEE